MTSPLDQPEAPTPSETPKPDTVLPTVNDTSADAPRAAPLAIEDGSSVDASGMGAGEAKDEITTLDVGEGNVVKLDKLGPMIVNSDGTLSRIQNWQELHPIEQERTVRLLVKKRNVVRLQKLSEAESQPKDQSSNEKTEEPLSALKQSS